MLHLHDHNCMKNSRHFLFSDFLDAVFFLQFHPILHRPSTETPFFEWNVEFFLFNLLQVFAIDIDICWKAALLNLPYILRNRDHQWWCSYITNTGTKLISYFLANVNVDGKHLKLIKEINTQQCLRIETAFWLVVDKEVGRKWKKGQKEMAAVFHTVLVV